LGTDESRLFYGTVVRYYDAENAHKTEDLAFYEALAAEADGPILDVGSGTGRVVFHLAQAGHRVHGVEISPEMLARAERKLALLPDLVDQVTMIEGDVLQVDVPEQYALITVSYHVFMHLRTMDEQLAALERFREWLLPGGRLIIDLPNAGFLFATTDDGSIILERTFVEPESGHLVMQQSISDLDRAEQTMFITWIYDEMDDDGMVMRTLAPLTMHYYFPAEMRLLLRLVGLVEDEFYGDYDFVPFGDGLPRMIVTATRSQS
jgi:SAM-dependent methyltransferase